MLPLFSHIPYIVLLGSYPKSRAKVSICSSAYVQGTYFFIIIIKLFPEIPAGQIELDSNTYLR